MVYRGQQNRPWRLRCISLEGLTGISVFCIDGKACWIEPHYAADPSEAVPPKDIYNPGAKSEYVRLFFPLADREIISSAWIRYRPDAQLGHAATLVVSSGRYAPCIVSFTLTS